MFKMILVPTDGSVLSEKAIDAAIGCAKLTGGTIIAISVAEPYPFSPLSETGVAIDVSDYEDKMRERAQLNVQKVADAATIEHVACETLIALSYSPHEEIINAANKFHCDVIFMASHGRKGLNKLILGSETQRVLAHTTIPVLVLR